jgi:hypothetical protein
MPAARPTMKGDLPVRACTTLTEACLIAFGDCTTQAPALPKAVSGD